MFARHDTIAALATPVGTAAIALVRVSGPQVGALSVALGGGKPPTARVACRVDYRDLADVLVDDVLLTFFAGPNSYTGEDSLEISCHGNPYIAQRVLEDLCQRGCRPAGPGEFTQRAFLNGRMDLSQAEAVMDLIHARSERALAMANQQLRGSLGRNMEGLVARLVAVLAQIEAYIDFPEEDLPAENKAAVLAEIMAIRDSAGRLLATQHYRDLVMEGIGTVILGKPNAGKSSLLNRLAGHERALVSEEPGTTRDYLEERITVGGHLFRLIDTAGLNQAAGGLELRGIAKSIEQAAKADLFLWVMDVTEPLPTEAQLPHRAMSSANTIVVMNKIDLLASRTPPTSIGSLRSVTVSAERGDGISGLLEELKVAAARLRPEIGDELVAINSRHAHALESARTCLGSATDGLKESLSIELIASDLRVAMAHLGEIAGRIDNEAILDSLFAKFCIGK